MMKNAQEFGEYLATKRKGYNYIKERVNFIEWFQGDLQGAAPTVALIDTFVRNRWCGYVSKDKHTFQVLSDYADFCGLTDPTFLEIFRAFARATFEGEARKAMKAYKAAMVFISPDTKINPLFLNGLSNDEFVRAFRALQDFMYAVYDAIEHGTPFDWGWPDWRELTWYGLIHNRVVMVLNALVACGHVENDALIVDKRRFAEHAQQRADEQIICKPPEKTKLLLEGLHKMGLHIQGLDDKNTPTFTVTFPTHPHVIPVLCAYFKQAQTTHHIRYFSYRFIEDPAAQSHETFFLAKTDGEPAHIRDIYYWHYDQAVLHGFTPTGDEKLYCYLYKKGTKEWFLLGKGSSYHEEEFLHSVDYELSAKFAFPKTYHTHPDKIAWLKERFPSSFNTRWGGCHRCKAKKGTMETCKHRVIIHPDNPHYRCIKGYLYFHNPTFDDIKTMLEIFKLENNIKPVY